MPENDKSYKKFLMLLAGSFVLVLGITLILTWWADVVGLFKGGIGLGLSLAGLLILYSLSK